MALGMMLPGMISGVVQQAVEYANFFIIVVAMALPGMALVPFIPLDDYESAKICSVSALVSLSEHRTKNPILFFCNKNTARAI